MASAVAFFCPSGRSIFFLKKSIKTLPIVIIYPLAENDPAFKVIAVRILSVERGVYEEVVFSVSFRCLYTGSLFCSAYPAQPDGNDPGGAGSFGVIGAYPGF